MASSNNPSKPLLFIFKIEFFFDQKIVDEIEKKKKFPEYEKIGVELSYP